MYRPIVNKKMKYTFSNELNAAFEFLDRIGYDEISNQCKTYEISEDSSVHREIFSWCRILTFVLSLAHNETNVEYYQKALLSWINAIPFRFKAHILSCIKEQSFYSILDERYTHIIDEELHRAQDEAVANRIMDSLKTFLKESGLELNEDTNIMVCPVRID